MTEKNEKTVEELQGETIEQLKQTVALLTTRLENLEVITVKKTEEQLKAEAETEAEKKHPLKDNFDKIFNMRFSKEEIAEFVEKEKFKVDCEVDEYLGAPGHMAPWWYDPSDREEAVAESLKRENEFLATVVKSALNDANKDYVDFCRNDYITLGIAFKEILDAKKKNDLAEGLWRIFAMSLSLDDKAAALNSTLLRIKDPRFEALLKEVGINGNLSG